MPISTSNRQKGRNQHSNVAFGSFSPRVESVLSELMSRDSFETLSRISPEKVKYIRDHIIEFDYQTFKYRDSKEHGKWHSYDAFVAKSPIETDFKPRYQHFNFDLRGSYKTKYLLSTALNFVREFDDIKTPKSFKNPLKDAEYDQLNDSISKIKSELKSIQIARLKNNSLDSKTLEKESAMEKELSELASKIHEGAEYRSKVRELFPLFKNSEGDLRSYKWTYE